jgi:hypothetical protein
MAVPDATSIPPAFASSLARLAWTAGFLDGEGSFGRPRSRISATVRATQVQRAPLAWLHRWYGGSLHRKRTPAGKDCSHWTLSGPRAIGLMMTLYPMLTPQRQAQVREVMAAWRLRPPAPHYRRTCPQGHRHDGIRPSGHRRCDTCIRIRSAAWERIRPRRYERKGEVGCPEL